ncbi:hypothetical protein T10_8296 [Trichinella papuae]|uniref:C2H2-type domain-containing protein n=1 Tax=Trichinella papuae TaxID=268474 RepID=A0A0V1N030_9BILA|nr:hypothetical protein T10_8296 [Trichinella papuae]
MMYECRYCQKPYKNVGALYNHEKIHEMYGIYTKIGSRHKNGKYQKIEKADLTTALITNNRNGIADENTSTSGEMVAANFGNVVDDGIHQDCQKTNQLIVRGNAELKPESNIPHPPKIRKTNL